MAKYTYNALGKRISEQYDCNDSGNTGATDGVTDSYDPVFFIALDRAGRRVATFRGTDTNPKETFIYHAGGSSSGHGPNFAGGVLLRDRDAACATPSNWATIAASATRAERYFYFADSRGSIMALVGADGVLAEQYRYSPTGVPFGIPGGDMDADGTVEGGSGQTDENIVKVTTPYEVRKDLNLDGDVDGDDENIVITSSGTTVGRGTLSIATIQSRLGLLGWEAEHSRSARWMPTRAKHDFHTVPDARNGPSSQVSDAIRSCLTDRLFGARTAHRREVYGAGSVAPWHSMCENTAHGKEADDAASRGTQAATWRSVRCAVEADRATAAQAETWREVE